MSPRRTLVVVGAVSVLLAGLGLYYNAVALSDAYPMVVARQKAGSPNNLAFFFRALYTISGICVVCGGLLAVSGLQLMRGRPRWVWLLTAVAAVEVALVLSVPMLWRSPVLGPSVTISST